MAAVDESSGLSALAQRAALVVAVVAGFLAIATFLANETVKEAITGETKAAETSARLEANDTKATLADGNAALLRVVGADTPQAEAALRKALELEARITRELAPVDAALAAEIRQDHADSAHANDQHFLFELASVALQIAIVLAGVAILTRRRWLLGTGVGVAVVGVGLLVAGLIV